MNRVKTRRIGAVLILAVVSTTAAGQAKAEVILNVDDLILACPCRFTRRWLSRANAPDARSRFNRGECRIGVG